MIVFIAGTLFVLIFLAWGTYRSAQLIHEIPSNVNLLLLPAENILRLMLIAVCVALGQVANLPHLKLFCDSSVII